LARLGGSALLAAGLWIAFGAQAAQAQVDLALSKIVSNPNPNVGDTVTFTVTLTDLSGTGATGVVVTDGLPSGLTFVNATPSQGSYAGGAWTVGTVAPGAPATLQIQATVVSPNPQTNTATITQSDQFDPNFANNSASATVTPQQADLSMTKTVSNANPNVGDTITFVLTLTNLGPSPANNVTVSDSLPGGLSLVVSSPSQGTYAFGTWTVGTVASGASPTLTIQAMVVSPNPQTNTATISHSDQFDPNIANNSASATESPQQADLVVAKSVSDPTPSVLDIINYTITVSNAGPSPATNVTVQDILPTGVSFRGSAPSEGNYDASSHTWTVGTIAVGTTQTLTIQAQVTSASPAANTASISHSDQFDPNLSNNSATTSVTASQADLVLSKIVSNATPNFGDTVTYTITLTNAGPANATSVHVTDVLPFGLGYVTSTASQGTYTSGSGDWNIGAVANGATATLQIQAKVNSTSTLTNTATISNSSQFDPNTGNNTASATITPQGADLGLGMIVSNANPNINDVVTFTITLNNAGPNQATNVQVSDLLPTGLSLQGSNASQGTYVSGVWNVGAVSTSAAATLTIQAKVTASGAQTNTATITHSDQSDPTNANNSASASIGTGSSAASAPTISMTFAPASVGLNQSTSLTFTLTNPNGAMMLSGVAFTDEFPGGLVIASPNGLVSTCGGSSSAPAGGTGYSLSGATLAPGASCVVTLNVVGTTLGAKVNTTFPVTSAQAPPSAPASASVTVAVVSTTSTTLTSSQNPSVHNQPVTFTATVASGGGTPTGTVTFLDGGSAIGTATLSGGVAAFTTSTLSIGSHAITASYGGANLFAASVSPPLAQAVGVPADSLKLRALQLAVTKIEAQASGAAFSGAVSSAIADGFADDGGPLLSANDGGVHFNFTAEPAPQDARRGPSQFDSVMSARASVMTDGALAAGPGTPAQPAAGTARISDAFNGLAFAQADRMPTKAPPRYAEPKDWRVWADIRGTGWNTDVTAGDIHGGQINALAGVTYRMTPNVLIGVLGGYENFDYTSNSLNGRLRGDGWTLGGYLGWRLAAGLRFDAAVGRSGVSYDGVAGTASATFPGTRWLASAGLMGTYRLQGFEIEPSAKIYALWEHEEQYLDSLGTLQASNDFSTGRASGGLKVAYPWHWTATTTLSPYVGLYADYYFSSSNAAPLLLPAEFIQGWAARVTAGVGYNTAGGTRMSVGADLGGIGNDFLTWTVRGRVAVPF
jgi:uncharacterized repeat protein (TIGR01451 family)